MCESFKWSDILKFCLCIRTFEQPFTCYVCKKSFRPSRNLSFISCFFPSIKMKENEKNQFTISSKCKVASTHSICGGSHIYDVCKKSVKQSGTLKLHLRANNGEFPFMCAVCE
jgi:hypothetical protein